MGKTAQLARDGFPYGYLAGELEYRGTIQNIALGIALLQKSQMVEIAESPSKSQNGKRIACLAQEAGHPASAQEEVEEEAANGGGV